MKQLNSGYAFEVDTIKKDAWHNLLLEFDDSSFYQTWSYGSISWGEENLSHLILMKDGKTASLAQFRIAKLPLPRSGFAYLTWGPIWRKKYQLADTEILRNMLRALYNEYAIKRGYLLRVIPKQVHEDEENIKKIYKDEGFSWFPDPQQTVYVDLTPPLEEIKKNLGSGWKKTLRRSMNIDMELIEDADGKLNDTAIIIIEEMKRRKGFVEFGSMENNIIINKDLPNSLKIKLVFCKFENEMVAVFGWSIIGDVGLPLVSATGDKALKSLAPHRFYWKMIEYYKNNGFRKCDLAGINKEKNPGGYQFKIGVAGEKRVEKNYIGQFDASENIISSLCFKTGMSLRQHYRDFLIKINRVLK
jgi:hypothetical protein